MVSAGHWHTMAIKTDGSLWAWGTNNYYQLGDGTTENSHSPKKIMDSAVAISSGGAQSMALKKDGSLWVWGTADFGFRLAAEPIMGTYRVPTKVMDGVMLPGDTLATPMPAEPEQIEELLQPDAIVPANESIRIQVTINETEFIINGEVGVMDTPPVIVDERALVPIRFFAESFGADVDWDDDTQTVTIIYEDKTLSFIIGESAFGMDVPPAQILNNRTMVPLRFISEYFNASVEWDPETRIITIENTVS